MQKIFMVFMAGFMTGVLIGGIYFQPEKTKIITDIIQTIVIIMATVFTAWWTSKTFGHELRSKEASYIIKDLQKIQNILPDIVHPTPSIEDLKDILMSGESMEKKLEDLTKESQNKAFYDYLTLSEEIVQKTYVSLTLKPFTKSKIFRLINSHRSKESILSDVDKSFMKEIIYLQGDIAEEAYFDLAIAFVKMRNKIGM